MQSLLEIGDLINTEIFDSVNHIFELYMCILYINCE